MLYIKREQLPETEMMALWVVLDKFAAILATEAPDRSDLWNDVLLQAEKVVNEYKAKVG